MAILFGGGVLMTDKSLAPKSENWRVLGIGVAERVRMSTFDLRVFSLSLIFTPNFCSSSIIKSPKSLNFISFPTILCVPINISNLPSSKFFKVWFCCFVVLNLLI